MEFLQGKKTRAFPKVSKIVDLQGEFCSLFALIMKLIAADENGFQIRILHRKILNTPKEKKLDTTLQKFTKKYMIKRYQQKNFVQKLHWD